MKCWSCEAQTNGQPFCPACGKIANRPPSATHFDMFGLSPSPAVDTATLEKQFRELSLRLHPDRFSQAAPKERRLSLEQTTALNDAYKTLKDPIKRAFYLLKLRGVDLDREEQPNSDEVTKKISTPPLEFLEEVMELRETLDTTRAKKDLAGAQKMAADVAQRRTEALNDAVAALSAPASPAELEKAAQALGRVRYFTRFLEEVDAMEEEETLA